MIAWHDELAQLYGKHNPDRLPELPRILNDFAGYEEMLWLTLVKKYGIPNNEASPRVHKLYEVASARSVKQRVIRIYAKHHPSKLKELDSTLELMQRDGPGRVFNLLLQKYGNEPPMQPETYTERILVLYATYDKTDRIDDLPQLLASYEGMEETLIRRLVNELGPEPHASDTGDPREPRERLRRIFLMYAPESMKRVELLLSRYRGNEMALFALMQRQYGREPTEYDLRKFREEQVALEIVREEERKRQKEEAERKEKERRAEQEVAVTRKMLEIGALTWDVGSLKKLEELPGRAERADVLHTLRDHLEHGDQLSYDNYRILAADMFRVYDRDLLPMSDFLVRKRFETDEANELLALLDCMYANAVPLNARTSLRTVVSLLEMKHGSTLEEIWVAGGVEKFLQRIEPQSRDEWAVYLTMLHGTVTEAELASRNRLRAYYLYYNPGTPLAEVDELLKSIGNDPSSIYDAMSKHYGPEPEPVAVDTDRVQKILEKNEPSKLSTMDVVIEAHCCIGDTPDMVVRRVARTYGAEPSPIDDEVTSLLAEELDTRFDIFTNELRLRNVLLRKKTMMEHPDLDVLNSIIHGAPQYHDDLSRAMAAADDGRSDDVLGVVERDERDKRLAVEEQQQYAVKQIVEVYAGLLNMWDVDENVELAEMLKRLCSEDDEVLVRGSIFQQMKGEEAELLQWLAGRLVWRAKWKRDDELRREQEAEEVRKRDLLLEAERQPPPVPIVSAVHTEDMRQRYEAFHEQAAKVMRFNAAVAAARLKKTPDDRWGGELHATRPFHANCMFHRPEFTVVRPEEPTEAQDGDDEDASLYQHDWELVFRQQCSDYVRLLLQSYEPLRLPTIGTLLRTHDGKEHELVAALEQQYGVQHWREQNVRSRVESYYRRVAPNRTEEIPALLNRFATKPELLWPYLRTRYGYDPSARSAEVRTYLVDRLANYLARVAPDRLPECDTLIDKCEDHNADTLFHRLTAMYGPEDRHFEIEAIQLKLTAFYKQRKMPAVLPHVPLIARRFAGRQTLLNEVLKRKFNATLDGTDIDPDDVMTSARQVS